MQEAANSARVARISQASSLDMDRAFLASRHYTVSELLGQGGFGQVAKGVNTLTGEEYVRGVMLAAAGDAASCEGLAGVCVVR